MALPNLRLSSAVLGGLARPGFSDSVGKAIGAAVAAPEERRKKGMLTDLLAPLVDPAATSADYATAARGLMGIDQKSALTIAAQGRELAVKEKETEQINARKRALATRADELCLTDVAIAFGE